MTLIDLEVQGTTRPVFFPVDLHRTPVSFDSSARVGHSTGTVSVKLSAVDVPYCTFHAVYTGSNSGRLLVCLRSSVDDVRILTVSCVEWCSVATMSTCPLRP